MEQREAVICLWFEMWLKKVDLGITKLFSDGAVYVESWGPRYEGAAKIKPWFDEWNRRGTVVQWEIKQFIHSEKQTITEWKFKAEMDSGSVEEFDGVSLVEWSQEGKIVFLKEFGCNIHNYDPYQAGDKPQFREEATLWF